MSTTSSAQNADAAGYEAVRTELTKLGDSLRMLEKYKAPSDQKADFLVTQMVPVLARLMPYLPQLVAIGPNDFRELMFTIRSCYHSVYNPENDKSKPMPDHYELPRKITKFIQESRDADGPSSTKTRLTRSSTASGATSSGGNDAAGPASTTSTVVATLVPGTDEMSVDDDASVPAAAGTSAPSSTRKRPSSPSPLKPRRVSKRSRLELSSFNEEAFNASPALDLYASGSSVAELMKTAEALVVIPDPDLRKNPLAMKKRMYYIMVEVAVIHETLRSQIARRTQLIDEAALLAEALGDAPLVGSGTDVMVP